MVLVVYYMTMVEVKKGDDVIIAYGVRSPGCDWVGKSVEQIN